MLDLTTCTLQQLDDLRTAIEGELARRSGESIWLTGGKKVPPGGAILYNRPAIGGDSNTDTWYPTLEAANAALLVMAAGYETSVRRDGGLHLNYTHPGCCSSEAWVERNP